MIKLISANECKFCTEVLSPQLSQKFNYFQSQPNKQCNIISNSINTTFCIIESLHHSLYLKYSSSQNYHYTKYLNEILSNQRSEALVRYRDLLSFDDDSEECLNRFYSISESDEKLIMLGEYYKFHKDIPRLFMLPAIISLNWYHDRKRRVEYFRIAKLIEEENKNNPDKPPKGIVGDSPPPGRESENFTENQQNSSSLSILAQKGKILDEFSWLKQEWSHLSNKQQKSEIKQTPQKKTSKNPQNIQIKPQRKKGFQKLNFIKDLQFLNENEDKIVPPIVVKKVVENVQVPVQSKSSSPPLYLHLNKEQNKVEKAKWKRSIQLDEHTISSRQNNDQDQQHPPISARQSQQNINQQKRRRTSLSNILQIIKQSQKQKHGRQMSSKQVTPCNEQVPHISIAQSMKNKEQQKISALLTPQSLNCKPQQSLDLKNRNSMTCKSGANFSANLCSITPRDYKVPPSPRNNPNFNNMKGQYNQKVQMLELRVLTDLQSLQYLQTKHNPQKQSKKNCTLELDKISKQNFKSSLTQRVLTNSEYQTQRPPSKNSGTNLLRKKFNLHETNPFKHPINNQDYLKMYPSGTQSHRDKIENPNKIIGEQYILTNPVAHNTTKIKQQINTSNEKFKQTEMYYNNVTSTVSTYITQSQQSSTNKGTTVNPNCNIATNNMNSPTDRKKKLLQMDSQLYKAALSLAQKLNEQVKMNEINFQAKKGKQANSPNLRNQTEIETNSKNSIKVQKIQNKTHQLNPQLTQKFH